MITGKMTHPETHSDWRWWECSRCSDVAERDVRKDAWMSARGYGIIRVSESDVARCGAYDVVRMRWHRWAKENEVDPGPDAIEPPPEPGEEPGWQDTPEVDPF